jgi:hypothetical protein
VDEIIQSWDLASKGNKSPPTWWARCRRVIRHAGASTEFGGAVEILALARLFDATCKADV